MFKKILLGSALALVATASFANHAFPVTYMVFKGPQTMVHVNGEMVATRTRQNKPHRIVVTPHLMGKRADRGRVAFDFKSARTSAVKHSNYSVKLHYKHHELVKAYMYHGLSSVCKKGGKRNIVMIGYNKKGQITRLRCQHA